MYIYGLPAPNSLLVTWYVKIEMDSLKYFSLPVGMMLNFVNKAHWRGMAEDEQIANMHVRIWNFYF